MLNKFGDRLAGALFDAIWGALYGFIIVWWIMRQTGEVFDASPIETCAAAFALFGLVFGSAVADLIVAMTWVLAGFSKGASPWYQSNPLLKNDEHTPNLFRLLFAVALSLGLWFRHTHGLSLHF